MTIKRAFLYTLAGVALLVAGTAIGAYHGPRVEAIMPTDRFVADRMAECSLTVRIHEHAVANDDTTLERLVSGNMVSCGLLVSWHAEKIPARDLDTAERIRAASDEPVASL